MIKVKGFRIFSEKVAVQQKSDIDYCIEKGVMTNGKEMVLWFGYAKTDDGEYLFDTAFSDSLGIDYDEYAKLERYFPISHPYDDLEINCFPDEDTVNKLAEGIKQILIREGRWIGA